MSSITAKSYMSNILYKAYMAYMGKTNLLYTCNEYHHYRLVFMHVHHLYVYMYRPRSV